MNSVGKLYYLMGASGSGKDSLLAGVHQELPKISPNIPVRVAKRYITRPADAGGETHIAVATDEFANMVARDEFCMSWAAHGFRYGIHRELLDWLNSGSVVLLNGSRDYLEQARRVVPDLVPVLVEVSATVQQQRLAIRARENTREIAARLARVITVDATDSKLVVINNDDKLKQSIDMLCDLIRSNQPSGL